MRGVRRVVKNEYHPAHANPEDFHLYQLAEYDDNTGRIESLDHPLRVASVNECLGTEANETTKDA